MPPKSQPTNGYLMQHRQHVETDGDYAVTDQ